MKLNRIYKLTSCLDDPRFTEFEGEVETFRTVFRDKDTGQLHVKRLASSWKPPRVNGNVRQINHYPCINLGEPAFSEYAAQRLREMLEPNGELLPIISPKGSYCFYNLTTIADVLDTERSKIKWLRQPTTAGIIEHYEFLSGKMNDLTIFRIPQNWPHVYVTDQFVEKALSHKLTGMRFTKVWPLALGEKPEVIEAPVDSAKARGTAAATEQQAMAQSVYLDVAGGAKRQRTRALDYNEFEVALNAAIEPEDPHAFAIGHLEYSTDEDRFHRFFLSCPDADALAAKLDQFLRAKKIRDRVDIFARYGPFDDVEARTRKLPAKGRKRSKR